MQLLLDINAHIRDLRKKSETIDVLEILPIQQLFGWFGALHVYILYSALNAHT